MTDREASKLVFPELSYQLSGIFFEVHNALGRFCNEQQYADATERLLKRQGLSYIREFQLPKSFEGERAGRNKVDFLVEDKLVIELKAKRITMTIGKSRNTMRRMLTPRNRMMSQLFFPI